MVIRNMKKSWVKPEVRALNINRDTFGGTNRGAERAGKGPPPKKKGFSV